MTLQDTTTFAKAVNALQTLLLLGLMVALGVSLGRALLGPWWLLPAIGLALFAMLSSSSAAPGLALSFLRAQPISTADAPRAHRNHSRARAPRGSAGSPSPVSQPAWHGQRDEHGQVARSDPAAEERIRRLLARPF
jgi:hypothetical protein